MGHISPGWPRSGGDWCASRSGCPKRWNRRTFLADLRTFPDRAITLVMLLSGLRAAEFRSLRLADVDMGWGVVRDDTIAEVWLLYLGGG